MTNLLKQAVNLIHDGDRYYGHGRFFHEFIDDWAYHQTGLYKPSRPLKDEVTTISYELSNTIREAWEAVPGEDFIGHVIEDQFFSSISLIILTFVIFSFEFVATRFFLLFDPF